MKRSLKKFLKIFAVFSLVIITALAVFIIYLNSSAGQNFIKGLIISQIESSVNLKAEIGLLETDILSHINIAEITIYPDNKPGSHQLLNLKKLQVNYSLYDLIFSKRINHILADSLSIFITRDSLGRFNIPVLPEETDTETDSTFMLPLKVNLAEIQHVNTYYNDSFIPLGSRLTNLGIRIEKTNNENIYSIKTSFDSLSLNYFKGPIDVSNFYLSGHIKNNLTMMPASFRGKLSGMDFRGNLSSDESTVTMNLNIKGNPKSLATTVSEGDLFDLSPTLNADIKFKIKDYISSSEADLNIFIPDYSVNKINLKDFNLDGHFRSDTLYLNNFSLGISGGTASAAGWISFDSLLSHKFVLAVHNIDIGNPVLNPAGEYITRPLLADFNLNSEGYLSVTGLLKLRSGLRIFTDSSDILNASIILDNNYLTISSDTTPVSIKSAIYLNDMGYSGTAEINLMNLEVLSSLLNINGVEGTIKTVSSLKGTWSVPGFNTSISSSSINYNKIRVVDTMSVVMNSGSNEIFIDSSLVRGYLNNPDSISSLLGLDIISGSLNYSLSGKGSIKDPDFTFNAEILKPALGPVILDDAAVSLKLGVDTISLSEFRLKKDSVIVVTTGKIDLTELTGNFQTKLFNGNTTGYDTISAVVAYDSANNFIGRIGSDKLHLETLDCFLPELGIDSGELNMDLSFTYSDNSIQAYLPFEVSNLKRKNLFINSVTGAFSIEDNHFLIDSLMMKIGNNSARFHSLLELQKDQYGHYFIDQNSRTEGYLNGNNLELAVLNPLIEEYGNITGLSDLNLNWNGSLNNPHLNGSIDIKNSHINLPDSTQLLSDIKGSINFRDSAIEVQNLTAEIDKKPLSVNAEIKKTDTADFTAKLKINAAGVPLLNADANLKRDYLKMNLDANDLDLNMAGILFPVMKNVTGVLSSKILIDGKLNNPGINGILSIKNISYNPQFMNLNISNGQIIAHIEGNRGVLDTAFFNIGKGRLSAGGDLLYANNEIKNIKLNMKGSEFFISEPDHFSLKINDVNLNLRQEDQKYKLSGKVQLGTSRYIQDFELANLWEIFVAKTEGVIENKSSEEPLDLMEYIEEYQLKLLNSSDYFKKLDLDLTVENSDSIWIKNNVADFRVHPDLTLRGSIATPILSGRINVEEDGKIIFLDREFDLKEGIVEFENPERINPHLNISAESDVTSTTDIEDEGQTYHISLNLTGPLDDIDFNITSEPLLENIDIISLLTIGMTYQQLQASQDVNSALKDRAGVLTTLALSNKINNYYQDWFGDFLEIDKIGIGGNIFSPGEARLEFTKRWADRVEISYSTAIDNLEKQILKAKLKLIRYFYLEGQTDQQTESGVDLIFRYKFR